ncbi:MAG TPA: APC family permease [Candidatus Sulfotelmatobacter sp.]|jgi:amino acid transporter|nr:APC family permease [Candidatus Sulfotelmatobacter sp.]
MDIIKNYLSNHHKRTKKLNQFFATAICGNDILSSTFYVSSIAILYAGVYAPLVLLIIIVVLYFYKSVYTEVVEAIPINGGAYNCLLNASSKSIASFAGTMTILSYIATAVISAKTAVAYVHSIIVLPVIPITIGLLAVFAALVVSGVKDSAKVALSIFVLHIYILSIFLILGVLYVSQPHTTLHFAENFSHMKNITANTGGIVTALFFGFSASLLGVSGFESSANFVEEQAKNVFRKTLRNMLIGVAIFNPLIALIALVIMPYSQIVGSKDFLLANAAQILGGKYFEYIVVGDAFLVLAGAVLTGYVGVSGLIYRMTSDGCFPNILAKVSKKGSYPYIIILFFLLCSSILIITKGDLLSLAGVYTIAFLGVMSLFAFGNLLMRETRATLKRTYHAPLVVVILALAATTAGIVGNIRLNPKNLDFFLFYFIPAFIIVLISLKIDLIYKGLLRFSKNIPLIYNFIHRHFEDITSGKFIVFVHHLDRLYEILDYINRNEVGRHIYLIHCNNNAYVRGNKQYKQSFEEFKHALPHLKKAGVFPHYSIKLLFKNEPFGPKVINEISKELRIRKSRILIGSIHKEHEFDYEDLGGVRIIF